jgi:hypothetical protein
VIKQYVNLEVNAEDHHGNTVYLEVAASNIDDEDVERVEWWVEPQGGDNTPDRYLAFASRARMLREVTGNRDNKFNNTLNLPHVGGNQYKVKCSKYEDRSTTQESDVFQTWRKLFFTVHCMNDSCEQIFNRVKARFKAAFEEAFIELVEVTVDRTRRDEPQTKSTNFLTHLYRRWPRLSNRPFHLRIVVLNDIGDIVGGRYTDTGVCVKHFFMDTDNDLSMVRGHDWRRRVHARIMPRGRWRNIRRYASKAGDRRIEIDLREHRRISRAIDDGESIEVRVQTWEFDAYCGHSIGNFICVRVNEPGTEAEIQTTILQTFTHELGHGLQQTVRRERTYNDSGVADGWENNALWHTDDKGGRGPHCAKNAMLEASAETTSGQIYTHDSGTLCTMFFRADAAVDANGEFCDACLPRLKRVDIGAEAMRGQGWNRC